MSDINLVALHVCRFTTLDDLSAKEQRDPLAVLSCLDKAGGHFSAFDATSTAAMAATMTFLERRSGWIERTAEQPEYPWVQVRITDAGRAELEGNHGK